MTDAERHSGRGHFLLPTGQARSVSGSSTTTSRMMVRSSEMVRRSRNTGEESSAEPRGSDLTAVSDSCTTEESDADVEHESEAGTVGTKREETESRRSRGRPRLTETDRARRRLESRRKYDVRRVYLGEAHELWVELRRRNGWTDAKLAAYLIAVEKSYSKNSKQPGNVSELKSSPEKWKRRRRNSVNSLRNLAVWYEDHHNCCPYEPVLCELESVFGFSTRAVWQCEAGHHYLQELHSPQKKACGPDIQAEADSTLTDKDKKELTNGITEGDTVSEASESDSDERVSLKQVSNGPVDHQNPAAQKTALLDLTENPPAEGGISQPSNGSSKFGTMVCVPVQVSTNTGTMYDSVGQEAVGEVVSSSQMESMVQNSQVIIIAGPGYDALTSDGIHLNVTGAAEEGVPCTVLDPVTFNQVCEPNVSTVEQNSELEYLSLKNETKVLEMKKDIEDAVPEPDGEPDPETESENPDLSALIYKIPKEPEKVKKGRRGRNTDEDGMLDMFHCPYEGCNQVYIALSSYQNHVNLVHRKGKTKVCSHPGCGKKFYLSNHLRRHMIIHSGVRNFTCETCGKSFKRKNHLEVHRRTHTGETPLQCEICGFQCRQRASLNWHMKKHISEVQYNFRCEECGKWFEKRDSVKFHRLKSHPEFLTA
ncbi:zinc finger protein 653 [Protopterus annectens]|uniref:zinc finger protein 653 n=1 Tax=Protopterus annectens TaxID=7888 RepID=UPI001CFA05D5|nr:zinc finger protein 653 [Protopterus annectens]